MKNSFNDNLNKKFNERMRFNITVSETRKLVKMFVECMDEEVRSGNVLHFQGAFKMEQVTRMTAHGNPKTMKPVPPRPRKKVKVKFFKNFGGACIIDNSKNNEA